MAGPPSIDLAVEMAIDLAGGSEVLSLIADQDRVHNPGIQFQLNLEPPQSEIDFVEVVVDAHGPVFAHDSVDAGVEEPVQVQLWIQGTQKRQSSGETILRTFADAVVMARVIDLLQPTGEFAVKFLQRPNPLARQTQAGFKILLQGPEHSFHFPSAPGFSRLGMDESDAQVGADDLEVVVDEGPPMVSI